MYHLQASTLVQRLRTLRPTPGDNQFERPMRKVEKAIVDILAGAIATFGGRGNGEELIDIAHSHPVPTEKGCADGGKDQNTGEKPLLYLVCRDSQFGEKQRMRFSLYGHSSAATKK